mgnify:CR=1 FL=1
MESPDELYKRKAQEVETVKSEAFKRGEDEPCSKCEGRGYWSPCPNWNADLYQEDPWAVFACKVCEVFKDDATAKRVHDMESMLDRMEGFIR